MPRMTRRSGEEVFDSEIKTTAFTALPERLYCLDASSGDFDLHLPTASGIGGQDIVVYAKHNSVNQITVVPSGTETIKGRANLILNARDAVVLSSDGVSDWMVPTPASEVASAQAGILQIWVNSATGDDSNDGLSESTPKLTVTAGVAVIPTIITHTVYLNLRGTFSDFDAKITSTVSNQSQSSNIWEQGRLVIDGGPDLTVLEGPHTADTSSISTIGLSSLSLTADEWFGYWIEILDGDAAGEIRQIHSHTTTTFTMVRHFSTDPGNASFRVVRPTTTIRSTGSTTRFNLDGFGGLAKFQRLYLDATSGSSCWLLRSFNSQGFQPAVSAVIYNVGNNALDIGNGVQLSVNYSVVDPSTLALDTLQRTSLSQIHASGRVEVRAFRNILIQGLCCRKVTLKDSGLRWVFRRGGRMIGAGADPFTMQGCYQTTGDSIVQNASGYTDPSLEGDTTNAVFLHSCPWIQWNGGVVKDATTDGIKVRDSRLEFGSTACAGTGNGGVGVRGESRAFITFPDGSPPTVTGTGGDAAVDASTSTWATIDGGTPLGETASNPLTVIKEQ